MNYGNVDKILKELNNVYPSGNLISRLASHFKIGDKEKREISTFLLEEELIEQYQSIYRLTRKGRIVVNDYGGIAEYFNALGQQVKKEKEIERLKEQKLISETKLTNLQAKTFWYFFILSIIGGLFAIFTTIERIFQEPIEDRIDRLIEERISAQNRLDEFSIDQTKNIGETEEQMSDTLKSE